MVNPNWGLLDGGRSFQNALAGGFQYGQQIKAERQKTERDNALSAYALNPNDPAAYEGLAKAAPQYAIQVQGQRAQQEQEARAQQLRAAAAQGDPGAMAQLAGIDINAWRGLSADQKKAADEQTTIFANAALDVLNRPPEQRPAALNAYIDHFGKPELDEYRSLQGPELEQALRAVIAQSNMIGKLHEMENPRYQVMGLGDTLVDTRNPQAVQQFQQGGQNLPRISSPDEAKRLPPGSRFMLPDGRVGTVPGGADSNVGGNFLDGL